MSSVYRFHFLKIFIRDCRFVIIKPICHVKYCGTLEKFRVTILATPTTPYLLFHPQLGVYYDGLLLSVVNHLFEKPNHTLQSTFKPYYGYLPQPDEGREFLEQLQMFEKGNKNGNEDKKNEDKDNDNTNQSSKETANVSKKDKRILRFNVPSVQTLSSEESFASAVSYNPTEDEEYEYVTRKQIHSVLRKYILTPLRHSQPRSASITHICRKIDRPSNISLMSTSSRQLFEIETHSPTLSDANINLINATYQRKLEAVKEAILEGADVNTHRDRQTPLLIAVEIGDDRLVEYLLSVPNININFRNNFGQTPLFVAVKNSFDRTVKHLLRNNADVNIADNLGRTPLFAAVFQKRLKLTKVLLVYGSDCDKRDLFGDTPLEATVTKTPDIECLLTLLKVGASPESVNLSGLPLLSRAILCFTDFRIIEALVQYGASVNHQDRFTKKTPLHFAALTDNFKVAQFLIDHGADVNIKSTYGFTPHEEAFVHNNKAMAEYLMVKTTRGKKENVKWPKKGRTDLLSI